MAKRRCSGLHGAALSSCRKAKRKRRGQLSGANKRLPRRRRPRKAALRGIDHDAVTELMLYANNDGVLYRAAYTPISKNLAKKLRRGTYNPRLGARAWYYFVNSAATKYCREHVAGSTTACLRTVFPTKTRKTAARLFAHDWRKRCKLGEVPGC